MPPRGKIFVSHSWDDKPFVERLKPFIESLGFDVWLDNYEIGAGESIAKRIVDGISESDYFCLVLSPKAMTSPWVQLEMLLAIEKWVIDFRMSRSFLIPLFRVPCVIWKGIRGLSYIDFTDDRLFEEKCEEVKNALIHPDRSELCTKQKSFTPTEPSIRVFKDSLRKRIWAEEQNYIPRPVSRKGEHSPFPGLRRNSPTMSLRETVLRMPRLILLSEAGMGKSTELKHLTHELCNEDTLLVPVFASLNTYVDQELETYVPDVQRFPEEVTVLILDGFDEVQSEHKNTLVRRLEHFSQTHPLCRIILSSRTNLSQDVRSFEKVYLTELSYADCIDYVARELGSASQGFTNELGRKEYADLVFHPFYLGLLVRIFRTNGNLPERRADVIERFVQDQLAVDAAKFRTTIQGIQKQLPMIRTELERLAFVAETLGRNFLSNEEIMNLLPDEALRNCVCSMSLLRKNVAGNEAWQFQHNSIQEYLAALVLSRCDLDIVKGHLTFDSDGQSFKPTWSNAAGFLLNVLADDQSALDVVVDWLHDSAPEVLLKSERDRISEVIRIGIFKRIFEGYADKGIHISHTLHNIRELGRFGDSKQTVEYLLSVIESQPKEAVLDNAVELLRFMTIQPSQRERTHQLLIKIVESNSNHHVICSSLLTLAELHLNDATTAERIVRAVGRSENTWIRFGLYYFLHTGPAINNYADVFLEGLPFTRMSIGIESDFSDTRLGNESIELQQGLKKITAPDGLKKVISHFISRPEDVNLAHLSEELVHITANAVKAFNQDPSIWDLMADLYRALIAGHLHAEVKIVLSFFDSTTTRELLFQRAFGLRDNDKDWYANVAPILTPGLANRIADSFVSGEITEHDVWVLRNFIQWETGSTSDWYLEVMNRATGNRFLLPPPRDFEAERKARADADHLLLFNQARFIDEVKRIYDTEGKSTLSKDDLRGVRMGCRENPFYSELVMRTLDDMVEAEPKNYGQIRELISKSDWDLFVAFTLYERMAHRREIPLTPEQMGVLERWYHANIAKVDFREALHSKTRDSANASHLAIVLWYFTRHFDFPCSPEVLLDMLSFDWVDGHEMAGIGFVEDRIEGEAIADRVINNLGRGIQNDSVLKNHLDYCKRHRIEDVVQFCPAIVTDSQWRDEVRLMALDVLSTFGSSKPAVQQLLSSLTGEFKWAALDKYREIEKVTVAGRLLEIIRSGELAERKRASMMLMRMGVIDGLKTFVEITRQEMRADGLLHDRDLFDNVAVPEAIPLFVALLELSYEPSFKEDRLHSIQSATLYALRRAAILHGAVAEVSRLIRSLISRRQDEIDSIRYLYDFISELVRDEKINRTLKIDLPTAKAECDKILGRN